MRQLPPLRALQAFEAASRLGSFAKAAEELLITPSAVSHQIRWLERELSLRLFVRAQRSVILTDAGRRYADDIAEAFGIIEAATRGLDHVGQSDILTVHAVPSFAAQWLMPRLQGFGTEHPGIGIRLKASVDRMDLVAGEADIDIQYGPVSSDPRIEVVPMPEETIVVLCAPRLIEGEKAVRQLEDLAHHPLIFSEINLVGWRQWLTLMGAGHVPIHRGLRFDRTFMSISAATDGLGVGLESLMLIERELKTGKLVLPFGRSGPKLVCHRLMFIRRNRDLPKVKAFREWIARQLAIAEA